MGRIYDELYKILGVKKDATMDEIKKALRKKAKETHPDRGGNSEDFHLVAVAGRILRSEKDRAEYDATGNYEETRKEDPYTQAEKILVEYFFKILASLTPEKIKHKDLINAMSNSIRQDIQQLKERQEVTKVNVDMQQKVLKRLKRKGKKTTGLIFTALKENINTLERSMDMVATEIKELDLSSTLLNDYSYDWEPMEEQRMEGVFHIGTGGRVRNKIFDPDHPW